MKNKYLNNAHISEAKFRKVLKYFASDFDATKCCQLTNLSRKTINKLYHKFRVRIYQIEENQSNKINGEIEIDEAYFGAKRIRGKKGRGAKGKIPVIGLLKRNGKVFTQIINNCTRKELMPIIKGKILEKSTIYTDGWKSYDGLVLNGYKHYRIHHHENEFVRGKNHVNGIESFWSYTKRRLIKFNGIKKDKFLLHLKESQFRWNNRQDIYKLLLNNFREKPL
jgi:Transposase and inactivated derivatives